jgi:rubrerythrin
MMKREVLIENLQDAIRREESAVSIFMKHLSAIVTRSGLDKEKLSTAETIINFLVSENKRHRSILESLLEKITREQKDAY